MYWDCFSPYIDVQRRNRLAGLDAELIRPDGKKVLGTYMFTLDWSWENKGIPDLNFSETPELIYSRLRQVISMLTPIIVSFGTIILGFLIELKKIQVMR